MQLDVVQLAAEHSENALERADLVDDVVVGLVRRDVEPAPSEADEVGQSRVRADREPVLHRQAGGREHRGRIAAVEAAREVDGGRVREGAGVVPHAPRAIGLAGVDVHIDDGHGLRSYVLASCVDGLAPATPCYCADQER